MKWDPDDSFEYNITKARRILRHEYMIPEIDISDLDLLLTRINESTISRYKTIRLKSRNGFQYQIDNLEANSNEEILFDRYDLIRNIVIGIVLGCILILSYICI